MTEADGKTGSVLYFEPLRVELSDCFGSLKNITPDSVFRARKGMIEKNKNSPDIEESSDKADKSEKQNKQSKSKFLIFNSTNKYLLYYPFKYFYKLCNNNTINILNFFYH